MYLPNLPNVKFGYSLEYNIIKKVFEFKKY